MNKLKIADKESFERGDDLTTSIPDGYVNFKNISEQEIDLVYGINDLRLPEYHKNNGITKIILKDGQNQQIISYLRVT